MAIERKTVAIPARTESQIVKVTCDLCGAVKPMNPYFEHNWAADHFAVDETEVSMRSGNRYPEGGSIDALDWHICPKCFREKLIPWLESQGARPTAKDMGY